MYKTIFSRDLSLDLILSAVGLAASGGGGGGGGGGALVPAAAGITQLPFRFRAMMLRALRDVATIPSNRPEV